MPHRAADGGSAPVPTGRQTPPGRQAGAGVAQSTKRCDRRRTARTQTSRAAGPSDSRQADKPQIGYRQRPAGADAAGARHGLATLRAQQVVHTIKSGQLPQLARHADDTQIAAPAARLTLASQQQCNHGAVEFAQRRRVERHDIGRLQQRQQPLQPCAAFTHRAPRGQDHRRHGVQSGRWWVRKAACAPFPPVPCRPRPHCRPGVHLKCEHEPDRQPRGQDDCE